VILLFKNLCLKRFSRAKFLKLTALALVGFLIFGSVFSNFVFAAEISAPKISVIVPIYNGEKYLRECLGSILGQTFSDIEIICVNDCSTDQTPEILREFAEKDSRVIIVNIEKKLGRVPAIPRNRGLDVARGEFVAFVDADDILSPLAYEKAYAAAARDGADVVAFSAHKFCGEETRKHITCYDAKFENSGMSLMLATPCYWTRPYIWHKIFRRSIIVENNIKLHENVGYSDDWFFNYDFLPYAKIISSISDDLYAWRVHKESHSRAKSKAFTKFERMAGQLNGFEHFLARFKNDPELESYKEDLVSRILSETYMYGDFWQLRRRDKKRIAAMAASLLNDDFFDGININNFHKSTVKTLKTINRYSKVKFKILKQKYKPSRLL
jgi:glycosyltransferase involved in cell wall biosynthesis